MNNPEDILGFICEIDLPYTKTVITDYGTYKFCKYELFNTESICTVTVSAYKSNKLVSCEVRNSTDENTFVLLGDIDMVKIMTWDSLLNIKPICEAEIIQKSKFTAE